MNMDLFWGNNHRQVKYQVVEEFVINNGSLIRAGSHYDAEGACDVLMTVPCCAAESERKACGEREK